MNTAGLTPRQAQALAFIAARAASGLGAPSLAEIGAAIGVGRKSTVHALLLGLRDRGRVTWTPNRKRSIQVVPDQTFTLPRGTQIALDRFCLARQEEAAAVVADAVLLHIDMLEASGRVAG